MKPHQNWRDFLTFVVLVAILSIGLPSNAQLNTYVDGQTFCKSFSAVTDKENGFYVEVPIDYSNPNKGTTKVYTYFVNGFDASKPTFIFFTGGPGGPSHFMDSPRIKFFSDLGFNFLPFDQRGIACSRPSFESLYLSETFYSTENVARDAEEIRKTLKINSVSIYGVSYGTTPATIYAHLFPQQTRAMVLEGILYGGEGFTLFEAKYTQNLIQNRFNKLPQLVRDRINDLTERGILNREWYASGMVMELGGWGDYIKLESTQVLAKGLSYPDNQVEVETRKLMQALFKPPQVDPSLIPLGISDSTVYRMISCKEFGISKESPLQRFELRQGKIQLLYEKDPLNVCGYSSPVPVKFLAKNYPNQVMTTYFHGTSDSKTSYPEAELHFENVAQGSAQLIAVLGGSHMPSGQISEMGSVDQQKSLRKLFRHFLLGEKVDAKITKDFNSAGIFKIKIASQK